MSHKRTVQVVFVLVQNLHGIAIGIRQPKDVGSGRQDQSGKFRGPSKRDYHILTPFNLI